MEQARIIVEVVAGLLPGEPIDKFTRRYAITSEEWAKILKEDRVAEAMAELNGKAQGYAALLMLQPDRLNWVRTDWIYL